MSRYGWATISFDDGPTYRGEVVLASDNPGAHGGLGGVDVSIRCPKEISNNKEATAMPQKTNPELRMTRQWAFNQFDHMLTNNKTPKTLFALPHSGSLDPAAHEDVSPEELANRRKLAAEYLRHVADLIELGDKGVK